MNSILLGHYVTTLDLIISDLQTRLDSKEDENKKNEEKMQELLTRIEECDDVIKAKQRFVSYGIHLSKAYKTYLLCGPKNFNHKYNFLMLGNLIDLPKKMIPYCNRWTPTALNLKLSPRRRQTLTKII